MTDKNRAPATVVVVKKRTPAPAPLPWTTETTAHDGVTSIVDAAGLEIVRSQPRRSRLASEADRVNLEHAARCANTRPALVAVVRDLVALADTCPSCNGTGAEDEDNACGRCGGVGEILRGGGHELAAMRAALAALD